MISVFLATNKNSISSSNSFLTLFLLRTSEFISDSENEIKNEPSEGCLYCSAKVKTENQTDLTGSIVEIIEISRGCENESQDDKQNVKRIEERFESGWVLNCGFSCRPLIGRRSQ